jgi:dTDP-4-dehydrorhamnose 3,5-epimerase
MEITVTPTRIEDVVVVDTDFFQDQRGFFIESYHKKRFIEHGIPYEFVQDNHSRSARGVLRGFHYQDDTAPMGKLVRCTAGRILDVAVDLRVGSPTCGRWVAVELSAESMRQIMVPHGFGHAFVALEDGSEVLYKCTGYYTPSAEGTVAWNDPEIGVEWPISDPLISARDSAGMSFKQYLDKPAFHYQGRHRG